MKAGILINSKWPQMYELFSVSQNGKSDHFDPFRTISGVSQNMRFYLPFFTFMLRLTNITSTSFVLRPSFILCVFLTMTNYQNIVDYDSSTRNLVRRNSQSVDKPNSWSASMWFEAFFALGRHHGRYNHRLLKRRRLWFVYRLSRGLRRVALKIYFARTCCSSSLSPLRANLLTTIKTKNRFKPFRTLTRRAEEG